MLQLLALLAASTVEQGLPPWMTGESRPDDLLITLVTFGPGDELVSWWGHSALVVEDRRLGESRLYNYGMFSFDEGFFGRFFMGRLEFWVSDQDPVGLTYRFYEHENRDVRLDELDLAPAQRAQIARALGENALPENRVYLYSHYWDNCSTRPRDLIDAAVGGQLKAATAGPGRMTLRAHTLRYARVDPPLALLLDFLQNDELDHPITQQAEAYLPDELERQVTSLLIERPDGSRGSLVARHVDLFRAQRAAPPERPPEWTGRLLLLGLGLAFGVLALAHLARDGARVPRLLLGLATALWGLLPGLLGTVLFIMGAVTNHTVTHRNENLFLANPLTLLLVPAGILLAVGSPRAPGLLWRVWRVLGGLTLLGIGLKVLPAFDQANWNLIALLAPVTLAFTLATWLARRRGVSPAPAPPPQR